MSKIGHFSYLNHHHLCGITAHPPYYPCILLAVYLGTQAKPLVGVTRDGWWVTVGMGILARDVLGSEEVIATYWSALRCVFKFMIALSSTNNYRILKCT